ncbi:ABC transporter permease [Bifidobacterium aquikefiri]|uniref:ABC transporter permease n=1 Tax=Bifidobacterium aquikefiri TaxID=1653207 RepID=UPI0039E7641A
MTMHNNSFANAGAILRINLRNDWLKIVLWILGMVGLMAIAAAKFGDLYGTQAAMQSIVVTLKTPSMVALLGPFFGTEPYESAMIYGSEMTVFMGLFAAMMNIHIAIGATRAQEDRGTVELMLSRATGRQSPLIAGVVELVIVNLAAGILESLGLAVAGMPGSDASGNWLFGMALAAFGMMFGTFALLMSQLASNARGATMLSYIILAVLFVTRMSTDVQKPQWTRWTLYGWIELIKPYMGNDWMPVLWMSVVCLAALAITIPLASAKDLGAGLVTAKPGRTTASVFLRGPLSLLARLERVSALIWVLGMFLLGASYGSIFGTIGDLVSTDGVLGNFLAGTAKDSGNQAIVLSLSGTLTSIFAVVVSIPAILAILRLNADESKGYMEMFHVKRVSRRRVFLVFLAFGAVIGTVCLAAAVLGMSIVGNQAMEQPISLAIFMRGFVGFWPAVMVVCGLAALLSGIIPRFQKVIWIIPLYGFMSLYIGGLMNLPKWTQRLSPYGWVNSVPTDGVNWTTFAWMTALSLFLAVAATELYRRRDLQLR